MKSPTWAFHCWWRNWRLWWGRPWGAEGWTPTLREWQIGPFRLTRFYDPRRIEQ